MVSGFCFDAFEGGVNPITRRLANGCCHVRVDRGARALGAVRRVGRTVKIPMGVAFPKDAFIGVDRKKNGPPQEQRVVVDPKCWAMLQGGFGIG